MTGGAGFIGSAVIRQYIQQTSYDIINLDSLIYAGNLESLISFSDSPRYCFKHVDINELERLFSQLGLMALCIWLLNIILTAPFPADFVQTNNSRHVFYE